MNLYFKFQICILETIVETTRRESVSMNIGAVDSTAIDKEIMTTKKERDTYQKWTPTDRFKIGKYAAENGNSAAVRKFKDEFPRLNESTVREFKKRYTAEVANAAKEKREVKEAIPRYSSETGRPLLLGDLDSMVQTYIKQLSNRGGVVNRTIANATAQALLTRYPNIVGEIDIFSSSWAQSLFRRMGYKKRRKTSSAVDIPDAARKEIEFLFLHGIVESVEKYKIPPSLILNLDQTPLKYVPVGNETMALGGAKSVTIEGSSDKRCITGTFAITMDNEFLPMHLIYKGKTEQSLPRFKFPKGFCLSANEKHFSNRLESMKYLKEVIVPYFKKQRSVEGLDVNQKALVIMDVFTGQMTPEVLASYKEFNICVENVPANMTKYYQPLDLTVNREAKRFLKRKFVDWYSKQVSDQLTAGKSLESVQVPLKLSIMKPLHAGWLVEFYNFMTSSEGKKYIESGWRTSGITDAISMGKENLPPIDPFNDLDPLLPSIEESEENVSVIAIPDEQNGIRSNSYEEDSQSSDEDSEWEYDERSAFDLYNE